MSTPEARMRLGESAQALRATKDPMDSSMADKLDQYSNLRASAPEPVQVARVGIVEKAVVEFNDTPHTPESYTATFQTIWRVRKDQLRHQGALLNFTVAPCSYTQEELDLLEKEGRRLGYLPAGLSTQEARHLLGDLWPQMRSHSVQKGNSVTNEVNRSGWFDYEVAIDAPHLDTTEDSLGKAVKKGKRQGMNLNEYIIASQDSKLLTGKYLDEVSTYARLLGSRDEGDVVDADFYGVGNLNVGSGLLPQDHYSDLGGRSVGVPKDA